MIQFDADQIAQIPVEIAAGYVDMTTALAGAASTSTTSHRAHSDGSLTPRRGHGPPLRHAIPQGVGSVGW